MPIECCQIEILPFHSSQYVLSLTAVFKNGVFKIFLIVLAKGIDQQFPFWNNVFVHSILNFVKSKLQVSAFVIPSRWLWTKLYICTYISSGTRRFCIKPTFPFCSSCSQLNGFLVTLWLWLMTLTARAPLSVHYRRAIDNFCREIDKNCRDISVVQIIVSSVFPSLRSLHHALPSCLPPGN